MMKCKKVLTTLLAAVLVLTMAACGGSSQSTGSTGSSSGSNSVSTGSSSESNASANSGSDSSAQSSGSTETVSGEITYTWGAMNGLYGDVETTYNENGTIASRSLINASTGNPWIILDYEYGTYPDETSVNTIYTRTVNGITLYSVSFTYKQDGDTYYVSNVNGLDFLKDTDYAQTTTSVIYNNSGTKQSGSTLYDWNGYSKYYWITELENGAPVETIVYSRDAYEDKECDLTWTTENGKVTGAKDGQNNTFTAEYSEDGLTLTLSADHSTSSDGKDYKIFTKYILTYGEGGYLTDISYEDYHEYSNDTDDRVIHAVITREADGKPVNSSYEDNGTGARSAAFTFDADGNLSGSNNMPGDDYDYCTYTWYANGGIETISYYKTYGEELDPKRLRFVDTYSEDGILTERDEYYNGLQDYAYKYNADGHKIYEGGYKESDEGVNYLCWEYYYTDDDFIYEQYDYYPDGQLKDHSAYNEHRLPILKETGEEAIAEYKERGSGSYTIGSLDGNVYTGVFYDNTGAETGKEVYTYGEETYSYVRYNADGTEWDGAFTDKAYDY